MVSSGVLVFRAKSRTICTLLSPSLLGPCQKTIYHRSNVVGIRLVRFKTGVEWMQKAPLR